MTGLAPAVILWMLTLVLVAACYDPDDEDEWVDEDGIDRTPGQDPREVGLP